MVVETPWVTVLWMFLTFGMLAGRPYFGLPGNSVSALVCFYLYARPALRRMEGHTALHLPTATAKLAHDLKKTEGLTEFVRCRLERTGWRSGRITVNVAPCPGAESTSIAPP